MFRDQGRRRRKLNEEAEAPLRVSGWIKGKCRFHVALLLWREDYGRPASSYDGCGFKRRR